MSALRIRFKRRAEITPGDYSRSPLSRSYVGWSLAAHVVALIAMLVLPGLRASQRTKPYVPTIDVVLLAPSPRPTSPAAPAVVPPKPDPQPTPPAPPEPEPDVVQARPEPEPVREDPLPDPTPPKPKPEPPPKKTPRPAPTTPAPDNPLAPSSGEADLRGDVAESAGGIELEGMGAEFDWYRDALIRALHASWRPPAMGSSSEVLEVAVRFEILRDGTVRGPRLSGPSGLALLDRSVLRAVQEATLPPLPRDVRKPVQPAEFVFVLQPDFR